MKKLVLATVSLIYMNLYSSETEFITIFEANSAQLKECKEEILALEDIPADMRKYLSDINLNSAKIETTSQPDSDGNYMVNVLCSFSFPITIFMKFLTLASKNPSIELSDNSSTSNKN